jgi:hypothetical protein
MRKRVLEQWLSGHELKLWLRRSTAAALIRVSIQAAAYLVCIALALAPLPYALNLFFGVIAGHVIAILFTVGTSSPSSSPSAMMRATRRSRRRCA